jgi:hypothetical protein
VLKTLATIGDRDDLLRRLKALRHDSTGRWGRMSAHQMVCHLRDTFLMGTGAKPVSTVTGWHYRTVMKWMALYAPVPWPAGIPTRPEVDQESGGTAPGSFAEDVASLDELVRHLTTSEGFFRNRPHPIFGRLSESAWMRWGYLHMDHHLRQFGV